MTTPPWGTGAPVIAVLRAPDAARLPMVIEALVSGGVVAIEVTMTTPGVLDTLGGLVAEFGDVAALGLGTVTTTAQADAAIAAGARFVVTPVVDHAVVRRAVEHGIPVYPGGFTPTELFTAWRAGASAVKLFPASAVGPRYLADLRGPFPDLPVMPSGGVDLESASDWMAAGAVAVSVGSPLLRDAFDGGDSKDLVSRARDLCDRTRASGAPGSAKTALTDPTTSVQVMATPSRQTYGQHTSQTS